jgi:hypothetical protein
MSRPPWVFFLTFAALAGCGETRQMCRYCETFSLSSAEASVVDALEAEANRLPDDHYRRCDFWSSARATGDARRWVAERVKSECSSAPFRGTAAERDGAIAAATRDLEPGAAFELATGTSKTHPVVRGRCYVVVLRFPEGFRPKHVSYDHVVISPPSRGRITLVSAKEGPGPVAVMDVGCIYVDHDAELKLAVQPESAAVTAEVQVFSRRISEAETAKRESQEAARNRQAENDSRAHTSARKREHCERCAHDLGTCGAQPRCREAYAECLAEDRGDFVVTAEECSGR